MRNRLSSTVVLAMFCLSAFPALASNAGSNQTAAAANPLRFAEGSISTAAYETTPTFTPDGQAAYFMRSSSGSGWPEIFVSAYANGKWTEARPAGLPPYSGSPAIAPDGRQIYFWAVTGPGVPPHLWVADKSGSGWTQPRPLGAPLDGDGGESSPFVATDGTLYFTANRTGSIGGSDVYRSRFVDGKYTAPENVREINSQFDELSVAVAPDGSFLVLSSRGRPDSRGESDLYLCLKRGQTWSPLMRLGAEINTAEDESNPQVSADGRYLYFTRSGDVYRVETASFLPRRTYEGPWRERAAMPTARVWARAVAWRDKLYVVNGVSGWGEGQHGVNAVEEYDPRADRWVSKANSPAGFEVNIMALDSGTLQLYGERGQSNSYSYSPSDDKWIARPDALPWAGGAAAGAVELAGRLFAMNCVWLEGRFVSSFVEYDSAASTWVTRRSPLLGTAGAQMAVASGHIYLFGAGEKLNAVQEYDPARDSWTVRSPMPTGRAEVRLASLNGKIYAVGGHSSVGAVSDAVEEYDPARDSWRSLPPLPEPRWGAAVAAANGKLYVFGGSPDAANFGPASANVWEYSPELSGK